METFQASHFTYMRKSLTNEELIQQITEGGKPMDSAIGWIYSSSGWVNIVKKVIRNMGASRQECEDIVQDGLISFIMDVQKGNLKNIDGAKSFFVRTCKNIWLNQYNRKIKGQQIIEKELTSEENKTGILPMFHKNEFWEHIDYLLGKLGRKCKEVLKLWSMGYSHNDIAKIVQYENANVSKKTKSICLEKLKSLGLNPEELKF